MEIVKFDTDKNKVQEITQKYFDDVNTLIEMHKELQKDKYKLNFIRMDVKTDHSERHQTCQMMGSWADIGNSLFYAYSKQISRIFKKFSSDRNEEIRKKVEVLAKKGEFDELNDYLMTFVNNYKFYIKESFLDRLQNNKGKYKTNQKNKVEKLIFHLYAYQSLNVNRVNYQAQSFMNEFKYLFGDVELCRSFKTFKNGNTHITLSDEASKIINYLLADETKIGR